jgi:hypothetical protein
MFEEKVTCAFKGMRRIKHSCNILIAKPEKSVFLEKFSCYNALKLLAHMPNTMATISSPALWQASKPPSRK